MKFLPLSIATILLTASAAWAGGEAPTSPASSTEPPSSNSSPPSTPETLPSISNIPSSYQQAGIINNSGVGGYGNLSTPSCNGLCVFAIGKTGRTSSGETNREIVAGAIWQISSPENTYAQAARLQAEVQRDSLNNQTTLVLTERLAEAIEKNKPERANAIAIILAPRLGYKNYQDLLHDVRRGR